MKMKPWKPLIYGNQLRNETLEANDNGSKVRNKTLEATDKCKSGKEETLEAELTNVNQVRPESRCQ